MLPLPEQFDENEWFIILTTVFGFILILLLPKRYPHVISILMVLFTVTIAIIMDHLIATPPLDLYDLNDLKKYEVTDIITYLMYSPYALLCIYLFDKFDPKGKYITAYVVFWSLFALGFESLAAFFNVFKYSGWTFLNSFAFYLLATSIYIFFFTFTRDLLKSNKVKFLPHRLKKS
ncbi:hypothetical protein [Ornithinibacillus contaminans]|uniref:hypothetical protein n=1 Tax=Ornithinibacillus contaminans TaxID=694055 RepID=UPI00069D7546|nr:hypothetical protein [Ornithinibacillus contaminans]